MTGRTRITGIMTAVFMAGVMAGCSVQTGNQAAPTAENSRQRKRFRKQSCKSPHTLSLRRYSLFPMLKRRQRQSR